MMDQVDPESLSEQMEIDCGGGKQLAHLQQIQSSISSLAQEKKGQKIKEDLDEINALCDKLLSLYQKVGKATIPSPKDTEKMQKLWGEMFGIYDQLEAQALKTENPNEGKIMAELSTHMKGLKGELKVKYPGEDKMPTNYPNDPNAIDKKQPVNSYQLLRKTRQENNVDWIMLTNQAMDLHQQILGKFYELKQQNALLNPLDYQIKQKIDTDNIELLFYVLADQFRQANKQFYKSEKPDDLLLLSLQAMYASECEDLTAYKVTFQENEKDCVNYERLCIDQKAQNEFRKKIKMGLSKAFSLNEDQIQIRALEKGSVQAICFIQNFHRKQIQEIDLKELKELFPNSKPEIKIHGLFDQAGLSASDFDPKYHMIWGRFSPGDYDLRGPKSNPMKYFFPCGWRGYALNIGKKYGESDDWLQMNGNEGEWYILFHGTKFGCLQSIVEGGLNPGERQKYENKDCLRTKEKVGRGVYFSNHTEVCRQYSNRTLVGDSNFYVAFQSRVNPKTVKQVKKDTDIKNQLEEYGRTGPQIDQNQNKRPWKLNSLQREDWDNDYYVVNNASDIRPYRILLYKETNTNR